MKQIYTNTLNENFSLFDYDIIKRFAVQIHLSREEIEFMKNHNLPISQLYRHTYITHSLFCASDQLSLPSKSPTS